MFAFVKKLLTLCTLAVFLIPMGATQVHSFAHRHDKHCTNTETHFCTSEHHCTLCDFVQFTSHIPGSNYQIKTAGSVSAPDIEWYQSAVITTCKTVYPLRGPPVLS